jgi:2-polyprenyl-3-methyl-5-hydroxy-6-metoxy-1,4-benzoquinol methylase
MTEPQIQANADPFEQIRRDVARYYADKAQLHGPTARGVDWNSEEGHRLRFDQLLRLIENDGPFSLLDYGCGYGALVEHLDARGARYTYQGYDIAEPMLVLARSRHTRPSVSFTSDVAALEPADYVVASGIFNVKQAVPTDVWQTYVLQTLDRSDSPGGASRSTS